METGACVLGTLLSRASSTARIFDSDTATNMMACLTAETLLPCPVFFSRLAATIAESNDLPPDAVHSSGQPKSTSAGPEPYSHFTLASILQACTMAARHRSVGEVAGLSRNVDAVLAAVEARLILRFNNGVRPDLQTVLKIVQAYYLQRVRFCLGHRWK
jgi:hypothetical protein